MRLIAIFTVLSAAPLFSAERMNVSVCNQGRLPEALVVHAQTEAETVFLSMGVQVVWARCEEEVATEEASRGQRFIIRLRADRPPKTAGQASLDALGRSYVSAPGDGYLADIYYKAVQQLAKVHGTDEDGVLGYVIAHELGHLLLGPGHSPHGIMHAPWDTSDAIAVKQRGLKFTIAQQQRIHSTLRVRNPTQMSQANLSK